MTAPETIALLPATGRPIRICEVLLRDGIQAWPRHIEIADKLRLLEAIIGTGIGEVDLTSFVSRRLVPQFSDAEQVLAAVGKRVPTRVLAVNADGARRAVEACQTAGAIDRCGIPFSASEAHNLANLRRTHDEHRLQVAEMIDLLSAQGIAPLLGVVTAFGCPLAGRVEVETVLDIAQWGYDRGVRAVMFGDTTGMGNPRTVASLFATARQRWPDAELIAHFHDNRGLAVANSLAAVSAGANTVDACLGGLGGEPRGVDLGLSGEQGNAVTEDLVAMFDAIGIDTGVNINRLIAAGETAERVIGRQLLSRVQRAGTVQNALGVH